MAAIIAEFFQIIGVEVAAPGNMAELIQYLLQVIIGLWLVTVVFSIFKELAAMLLDWRRFK